MSLAGWLLFRAGGLVRPSVGDFNVMAANGARATIPGTPILLYHQIVADRSSAQGMSWRARKYLVTAADLRGQLDWLRQNRVQIFCLRDVIDARKNDSHTVSAVITFDDGGRSDFLFAYPMLAEHGMTAEFFLTTNQIGKPGFLDWPEIQEMQRAGMSFQSHGADHVDLRRLAPQDLRSQLEHSKQTLEDRLGALVDFLAIPYGLFNQPVLETARAVGYAGVCSSVCWPARPGSALMGRAAIHWGDDLRTFRKMVQKDWTYYLTTRVLDALLNPAKMLARRFIPGYLGNTRVRTGTA